MALIAFFNPVNGKTAWMEISEFETLVKGSAIRSITPDKSYVKLELNDDFNLEFNASNNLIEPRLVASRKDKLPFLRLQLAKEGEFPPAWVVERRIHSLRQLYAIAFLLDANRAEELAIVLKSDPDADLEAKLLKEEDSLFISGASEGTWYITLLTKTRGAFRSLKTVAALFYDSGREAVLDRVSLETELKRLEVEEKGMRIYFETANKLVDLLQKVEKIKDPARREIIKEALEKNAAGAGKALPDLTRRRDRA